MYRCRPYPVIDVFFVSGVFVLTGSGFMDAPELPMRKCLPAGYTCLFNWSCSVLRCYLLLSILPLYWPCTLSYFSNFCPIRMRLLVCCLSSYPFECSAAQLLNNHGNCLLWHVGVFPGVWHPREAGMLMYGAKYEGWRPHNKCFVGVNSCDHASIYIQAYLSVMLSHVGCSSEENK
jgi:hypothetical protein